VLIRVSNEAFTTMKGRETWAPHGYVAYSKVCTHLGCPVGLYEQELQLLVCPCHQSMFNVTNGAVRSSVRRRDHCRNCRSNVDSSGYLRSQSDYHEAVGPGFWSVSERRHQHQALEATALGRYGRVGKTLDELDDRLGVARGGRTFMDKIFPTTGLSCSARSRSTRS